MKRTLIGILASTALALSYVPSADASALLKIDVDGTFVQCDNTGACGGAFVTVLNGSSISWNGTINGVSFTDVNLVGNSPGSAITGANVSDTKTTVTNTTGVNHAVTVSWAENNYALPAGTPVFFNATQGMDAVSSTTALTENFTGWGNGANTLALATGSASVTPACNTLPTLPSPPNSTNSCAQTGPLNSFVRAGNFALNGVESITLTPNATINAHGSVAASATQSTTVPEPGSMLLLGTGLIALGRTARRRLRKQ